jgi:hypothetical protein
MMLAHGFTIPQMVELALAGLAVRPFLLGRGVPHVL